MEHVREHWRVLSATLFSSVLIVGVYLVVRDVRTPSLVQASTESALLQAIATKDSDGDGLPDWEESLYGADPRVTDSFYLGMTDGQAVSRGLVVPKAIAEIPMASSTASVDSESPPTEDSLTATFAKIFFSLYLSAKQSSADGNLSEQDMQNVASNALKSLSSSIAPSPDFKFAKDLKISGSGVDAFKVFAISAEEVLSKRSSNARKSEVLYLQDAVEKNDTVALSFISTIAKSYRESAIGLSILPVPTELKEVNLVLINALMRLSKITDDFTRVGDDPLTTILAIQQYPQAILSVGNAFIRISRVYADAGIEIPAGTPGASFVNLIKNVSVSQHLDKKP